MTGIFLDPPYKTGSDFYVQDGAGVADEVAKWAADNGDGPAYRIVLASYDGEADMPATWRAVKWKASGVLHGNSGREVLWLSPHCSGAFRPGSLL